MPYSGGKQRVADQIVQLFPDHASYVEPFAGALSVLLAKAPAPIEVVNDLNGNLVAFWRVLRDRPADLERVCALTPHSRFEYVDSLDLEVDELEKARRVWVQLTQARGSRLEHKSGWRFVHGGNRTALSRYLQGYLDRIAPSAARLHHVSLECRDALEVINAYGLADALLYIDPPYLAETRDGDQYAHEFASPEQHGDLLDLVLAVPSKVAISGYPSRLYNTRLKGWERHEFASRNMRGAPRTEVLWTNFAPANTLPMGEAL